MDKTFSIERLKDEIFLRVFSHIPASNTRIKKTPKCGFIIAATPEVEQERYNVTNYLKYNTCEKTIYRFYQTLEDQFQHCDLRAFYRNLQTLKISSRKVNITDIISSKITGVVTPSSYNVGGNKMNLLRGDDTIANGFANHELFHMASTKQTADTIFCGFAQINRETKSKIGTALNEGYTEHLNRKYCLNTLETTYTNEITLAEEIELIVGSKKMEELYFSADLSGLIDELSKYTTRENAESIITRMDEIEKDKRKPELKTNDYTKVRGKIAEIYLEKQQQLLAKGLISEETYADRKLVHADIFVADNITIPEGAFLLRENGTAKIISTNGILSVKEGRYTAQNNLSSVTSISHK